MAGILLEGETVTDAERAEHARALSERNRALALERAAKGGAAANAERLARAVSVGGAVADDRIVPAGGHYSGIVKAGEKLRIIDIEGRQAVDFLCYDARDSKNRYNAANTMKFNRSIFTGKGTKIYSDLADILMTVTEDTVGFHDTIGGCCSSEANYLRYGIKDTPSCRNNFLAALASHGMDSRDMPANLNFFMYVPVAEDGSTEILEGRSEPGDFVELAAERDVLVAISNCPQVYNPCNGWNPTPIRLIRWR
jgi:urea carboxylase-associated protein 1